jgi:cell division protein FtsQ
MLKKINWRAILFSFLWLISLGGLITLMSFIEIKKSALKCKDVKVLLPGQFNFIERDEVDRILMDNAGAMVGIDMNDINIHKLENALKANPFIEFAKVYADMTGVIQVQIRQRVPVLRVVNMANLHFYIDGNGNKIPLSDNYTAKVLVASGFIEEDFSGRVDTLQTKMARDLFRTALYIKSDTLWDNQIEQLFVDLKGDIEMVPRVGGHKIILGSADSLKTKFRNLLVFYKKAIPKVGWDTYKTINLKYANQIVCEKNIIDTNKIMIDISKQIADSTVTETKN